jgi:ADP-heptose:LPS heptosyltransferase
LGNTLLLTPLIKELQTVYPGAEIDIVTRTPVGADIFGRFQNVRRIFCLPSRPFLHPVRYLAVLSKLRQARYDLVIDPHPHSRTGRALLRLSRATYRLGFSGFGDSVLTHAVPLSEGPQHTGHFPVHLLRSALGNKTKDVPTLDIALTPDERREGQDVLRRVQSQSDPAKARPVIGVFANATGPKLLPASWWEGLLENLAARAPEHAIVEIIPAFGRSMLGSHYPAYYSSDVRRLAGVLSQLSLFVSCDCGVMHLASASGAAVAGIFSNTDPSEWGPFGDRDVVIDIRGLTPAQAAERIAIPAL